jgi:hypothetical protein
MTTETVLRRYSMLQRVNLHAFWISFALIVGGCLLGMVIGEWAMFPVGLGFLIATILVAQAFLIYPYLRCPKCRGRFFLPNGILWAHVAKVDATRKACLHCGLSFQSTTANRQPREGAEPAATPHWGSWRRQRAAAWHARCTNLPSQFIAGKCQSVRGEGYARDNMSLNSGVDDLVARPYSTQSRQSGGL